MPAQKRQTLVLAVSKMKLDCSSVLVRPIVELPGTTQIIKALMDRNTQCESVGSEKPPVAGVCQRMKTDTLHHVNVFERIKYQINF